MIVVHCTFSDGVTVTQMIRGATDVGLAFRYFTYNSWDSCWIVPGTLED